MKRLPVTITVLQFFLTLKSHFACAWGNFALYGDCQNARNDPFIRHELNLVVESARSAKAALDTPNSDTDSFVQWMFGPRKTGYDPYAAPRASTGGTDDIVGLAGLSGEVRYRDAEGGDVVSSGAG